jgi:hypothetical protein
MSEAAEQAALSPEERAHHAERRHMFWRNRCIEHAKTIHRLEQALCVLQQQMRDVTTANSLATQTTCTTDGEIHRT